MNSHSNNPLDQLADQLDEIDKQIVRTVSRFRLVCAQQLTRLFFASPSGTDSTDARRARHRMARLVRLDVLARLPRRVGGYKPGSAGYVYRLGPLGLKLTKTSGSRNRGWTPGPAWIRHNLAITESYVRLRELHQASIIELLTFDPEPHCWRPFHGPSGSAETLKPDAYLIFRTSHYQAHWFLEIDRGTESRTVLHTKLQRYLSFFQTGQEQERLGLFPQVRFVVTLSGSPTLQSEAQRVKEIQSVIQRLAEPTQRLFVTSTLDELSDQIRAGPTIT